MSAKRTQMHRLQELVRLHRLGHGGRRVAQLLKMGPNTERQYRRALERAELLDGPVEDIPALETLRQAVEQHAPSRPAPQQQSSLAEWKPTVKLMLERGLRPKAVFDRLRLEHENFHGTRSALRRLIASIWRERGVQPGDVAIPVDTAPGDVAQVDFGYVGRLWDPDARRLRRAWVFVMVLGHSRHMFADVVFDQKTDTWLRLHEDAFHAFGGVPATLVPDNLKAAVIRAAFGLDADSGLNRSYRELARHYGFVVDPAPPRQAKKKGKVEAGVKYVKRNALAGREGDDVNEVRAALQRWIVEIAGDRVHGTTRRKPLEVFKQQEQAALKPLPLRPMERMIWRQATVHDDCCVEYERRLYSVPWRLIGQKVWIKAMPSAVVIQHDDETVARHDRRGSDYRSVLDHHLPDGRSDLRHRSRQYWQERAERLGADVGRFVNDVFDSDEVLSQLRKVQAAVTHLEKFPPERAQAACRRASFYGTLSYQAVRDILRLGLDFDPMPTCRAEPVWADAPRFARNVRELVANRLTADGGSDGAQ